MKSDTTQSVQPPPPDPELRRLNPLIGAWQAKDHTQDSTLGPGARHEFGGVPLAGRRILPGIDIRYNLW